MLLRTFLPALVLVPVLACPVSAHALSSGGSTIVADTRSATLERRASRAPSAWTAIEAGDWNDGRDKSTATLSADWTGRNGFVLDGEATDAWRVRIDRGEHYGADKWFRLPNGVREARLRYRILYPAGQDGRWGEADANIKLPGPAGRVNAANGGYGGSANSSLPHARRAWSARQSVQRPHPRYQDLAMGMELYGMFSQNPGSSDPLDAEFGDVEWYQASGASPNGALYLEQGRWTEIEVHVRMNDEGRANGFLRTYLDGMPGFGKENVEWSTDPNMLEVTQLWFDVYHGGDAKRSPGTLFLFFRGFEYQVLD